MDVMQCTPVATENGAMSGAEKSAPLQSLRIHKLEKRGNIATRVIVPKIGNSKGLHIMDVTLESQSTQRRGVMSPTL